MCWDQDDGRLLWSVKALMLEAVLNFSARRQIAASDWFLTGTDVTLKVLFGENSERGDPPGSPWGEKIAEHFQQVDKWKSQRV